MHNEQYGYMRLKIYEAITRKAIVYSVWSLSAL